MSRTRPARVRYYLDQDVRGLAVLLGSVRPDLTYPGDPGGTVQKRQRPPSPINQGALDVDWLPVAGKHGWLVVSRDHAIQTSVSELSAVQQHAVKMVCFTGKSGSSKWSQLETIMTYWHRIEELTERPGPFVYRMSKPGGLRAIDIDSTLHQLRNGRRRS